MPCATCCVRDANGDSCQEFPPRSTVYNYFWEWTRYGVLDRIHHLLLVKVRELEGREASPTAAIIDTQAVKATEKGGGSEGSHRIRRSKENEGHQTQCHRRYDRPASRHRGNSGQHPGPRLRCQPDPQDAPSVPMDCNNFCRRRLCWSETQSSACRPASLIGNR